MRFSALSGLGLCAGLASASPARARRLAERQTGHPQNVVYWGQNGGNTIENNDLSAYCKPNSGINTIVLAFLYEFGGSFGNVASGIIGQTCFITSAGQPQDCQPLAQAIATCQSNGVKIFLSLGGAVGSYSLSSDAQASAIGQYLWDAYGNSGNSTVTRPLGDNILDGFDFDIETNGGSGQFYHSMIETLRNNFATDPSRQYFISGAPQCPIPEPNMGGMISTSVFDMLFVQFYNNNNYQVPCALGLPGDAPLNFNNWTGWLQTTPSKNAKVFLGIPASEDAANGTPAGAAYYATPSELAQIVAQVATDPVFGGIMMWSAGFSDANMIDGCTYAQQAFAILNTGKPCTNGPISGGNSPSPTPTSTPPPSSPSPKPSNSSVPASSPASKPTSTPTPISIPSNSGGGTVNQWGQCGGEGYTGPTQCASPYKCVVLSVWWADCR